MQRRKRVLWPFVLLLAATPANALKINPEVTTVAEGGSFSLNATFKGQGQSRDCIYTWSQTGGPAAASFRLRDRQADGIAPRVYQSDTMTFQVVVSRPLGADLKCDETGSATATVNVLNSNSAPTAAITLLPNEVYEGASVTMNANGHDDDGDALTYHWEQTAGPAVTLSGTTGPTIYFTAPNEPGSTNGTNLEFRVTVTDTSGSIGTSTRAVTVKWENDPPKAALVCTPATVDEGKSVSLDGTGSTDSDDGIASYYWSQPLGYGGALIALPEDQATSGTVITAPFRTSKNSKMTFKLDVADQGGATDSATCDIAVNDISPPVFKDVPTDITAEATSSTGASVTFTPPAAEDLVDGLRPATCDPASDAMFELDKTTKVTCNASDESRNKAEASFNVAVVDTKAPELKLPTPIGPVEGDTLHGSAIDFEVSGSDIVDGNVGVTCNKDSGSLFPVGLTTVSCSAADVHGNTATGAFTVAVVDTKAPDIDVAGDIADGSSYYFGSVPAAPSCSATDVVSGTVKCSVSGYSSSVGTHTLKFTATDEANNTTSIARTYDVLPWTHRGFYTPVEMNGVTNTVKAGATVPLKFEIFVGATELVQPSSVLSIQTRNVPCLTMSGNETPVDAASTGSTSLRYDLTAEQFIYNWQTPKNPGACYIVTVTTLDGTPLNANFKLK